MQPLSNVHANAKSPLEVDELDRLLRRNGEDEAGLPFHSHGAAWLGVVHGGKHWFLYPPGGFDPDDRAMTTPLGGVADWFRRTYPNLAARPIECTQGPGDVLFVPTAWLQ